MTTILFWVPVLALLLASLPAFLACKDCSSSLANNDNIPYQNDKGLLTLWKEENFQGGAVGMPEGYVSVSFEWKFKSVQVPDGYAVILFEENDLAGAYVILTGDTATLDSIYFNDRTKSLKYIRNDENGLKHPQIFEKPNFSGQAHRLPFGITHLQDLTEFASIKIPVGMTVKLTTVYGPRFLKREIVLTSDSEQLPFSELVESIQVSVQTPDL